MAAHAGMLAADNRINHQKTVNTSLLMFLNFQPHKNEVNTKFINI